MNPAAIEACIDCKICRVSWQVFIALCCFAGLRKNEALNLKKVDVGLEQSPPLVKVLSRKTARSTEIPIRVVPVLFPILERLLVQANGETSLDEPWSSVASCPNPAAAITKR